MVPVQADVCKTCGEKYLDPKAIRAPTCPSSSSCQRGQKPFVIIMRSGPEPNDVRSVKDSHRAIVAADADRIDRIACVYSLRRNAESLAPVCISPGGRTKVARGADRGAIKPLVRSQKYFRPEGGREPRPPSGREVFNKVRLPGATRSARSPLATLVRPYRAKIIHESSGVSGLVTANRENPPDG